MLKFNTMKQRLTAPSIKGLATKYTLVALAAVIATSTVTGMMNPVSADTFDDQINALRNQSTQYQAEASRLNNQAATLQNELSRLDAEKSIIQTDINLSQARYDKLKADIKASEVKIQDNKDALGVTLADMYVDDAISPLEMLASSNNIGDYVDKQAYRSSVNDQLQGAITAIDTLKKQLEKQKVDVERVLLDQNNQKGALIEKENERADILNKTKGEEAAYQNLISEGDKQIRKVQAAQDAARQAALNRWASQGGGYVVSGGTGGYPYASPATQCWSSSCVDEWQLYYRECVSYVAWRLANQGYGVKKFGGAGHATQWPGTTASYTSQHSGSSGYTPRVGDAAVIPAWNPQIGHEFGHVSYVEEVYADGTIRVSEFNWLPSKYSERKINPGTYSSWIFLTFPRA